MFTVYGKANCSGCNTAKEELAKRGLPFVYQELGKDYTIQDFMGVAPRTHKNFPMISFNGEYQGGLPELLQYLKDLSK